ncbi:hypothetical protein [Nocardia arthritidis]|uniref:hypothetical protein n=1 Tax=Nocardia arthritidis TaxID=228602 RepID=UPI0007A4D055|nr:hypothetical protein [Nocardia arthritidis]
MTELRAFRQACYEAARRTGGTVIEFRVGEGVTPNFHQGVITYRDRHVAVVALRDSAVLAVAEPRAIDFDEGAIEAGPLTFVEAPDLVTALSEQAGFEILTAAELARPFDAAAWPELDRADIRFWKPETVGDALFNYWD